MKKNLFYILILLSAVCFAACSGQPWDDTGTVGESVTPDIAVTTVSPETSAVPESSESQHDSTDGSETSGQTSEITGTDTTVRTEPVITTSAPELTKAPETEPLTPVTSAELTSSKPEITTSPVTSDTDAPVTEPVPEETTAPVTEPVTEETTAPVTEPVTEDTTAPITEPEETTGPADPGEDPEIKGWPTSYLTEKFGENTVPEPECRNAEIIFNIDRETIIINGITLEEYYSFIDCLSSHGFIYNGDGNRYRRLIGDKILTVDVKFGEAIPRAFSVISFELKDATVWPNKEISEMFGKNTIPSFPEGKHSFFVQSSFESNSIIRIENVDSSAIGEYLLILKDDGFSYSQTYESYTKTVDTTIYSVSLDSDSESETVYMILAAYSAPVWPKNLLESAFGSSDFLPEFVTVNGIYYSDIAGSRVNIIISDASEAEKKAFVEDLLAMGYVFSDELDGYVRRSGGYRSHICITDGMVMLISIIHIPYEAFPVSELADTVWYYAVPDFVSMGADFAVDWSGSDDNTLKVYGFGVSEEEVTAYILRLINFGYVNTVFDEVYSFSYNFLGKNVQVTLKYDLQTRLLTFMAEYSNLAENEQ